MVVVVVVVMPGIGYIGREHSKLVSNDTTSSIQIEW